jgi:hypothetical protein
MAVLSARKREIVQTVIAAAPDSAIRSLELALAAAHSGDGLMSGVRALVETEASDRALRNVVLQPIVALCAPREPGALSFPPQTLAQLWRGLKAVCPEQIRSAASRLGWDRDEEPPPVLDEVCAIAAAALREPHEVFSSIDQKHAAELAACLDLAPLVRALSGKIETWTYNMTGERVAAARLAYRDAASVAEDAGPRFFEMLSAQLSRPWMILRIVSAVMDRPSESYLVASELSIFGDRVTATLASLVEQVQRFDPATGAGDGQGEHAGQIAGRTVEDALVGMAEFGESVALSKSGAWGGKMAHLKQALAKIVETRLSKLDRLVGAALPVEKPRTHPARGRGSPSLAADPDNVAITRAAGGLAFADAVRSAAANGGFGAARASALEAVNDRLNGYTDDLLNHLRDENAEQPQRARAFLEAAARLVALAQDETAAQILRRRIAAA